MFYWHRHINSISVPGKLKVLMNHPHLNWRNSARKEAPLVSQMRLLLLKWFPVITSPRSLSSKLRVTWRELSIPPLPPPTHLPPSLSFMLSPLNIRALHTLKMGLSCPSLVSRIHSCFPSLTPSSLPHLQRRRHRPLPHPAPNPPSDTTQPTAHTPQRLQAEFTLLYTWGSAQPPGHLRFLQKPWVVM